MKKILALVLSMLLVASCFALVAYAEEETTAAAEDTTAAAEGETTAAEDTTVAADGETTAAGEETTEEATSYSNTLLVFNEEAKAMKVLVNPTGLNKTIFKSEWEGARLLIKDPGDPYITINWANYIKKADVEKVDSQAYPFVVFKLMVVGYLDDIELFYCAGDVTGPVAGSSTTTDFPGMYDGSVEYIIYDLTGDCEGNYNQFRFDPMGADEGTEIYLYEMALFATEEEALKYAGYDEITEAPTTEAPETEEPTTEKAETPTKAPVKEEQSTEKAEEKGCGGIVTVGAAVAMIALGAVCLKKKD